MLDDVWTSSDGARLRRASAVLFSLSSWVSAARRPAGQQLEQLLTENSTADALRKRAPSLPVRTSSIMYRAVYNHQ